MNPASLLRVVDRIGHITLYLALTAAIFGATLLHHARRILGGFPC